MWAKRCVAYREERQYCDEAKYMAKREPGHLLLTLHWMRPLRGDEVLTATKQMLTRGCQNNDESPSRFAFVRADYSSMGVKSCQKRGLRSTPKRPLLGAHFEHQDGGERYRETDGKSDGYSRELGRLPAV